MLKKILNKAERGQAIVMIAFAMVGMIAIVGLMTDGEILLIEYAKLKRGIDAAAVASAQQFRKGFTGLELTDAANEFLILNQADAANIEVYTCNPEGIIDTLHDADLCNVPIRKLIRVDATRTVDFGFLRVIGINGTTITASSIGEAASLDLVLVFDTSFGMAYETTGNLRASDPGDDPALCNSTHTCLPLEYIKGAAQDFVDTMMFFPYDRVGIVTMTSQQPNGFRDSETPLALSDDDDIVRAAITDISVVEPAECPTAYGTCRDTCTVDEISVATDGTPCFGRSPGYYLGEACPARFAQGGNRSSCGGSNVGGALLRAGGEFTRDPMRDDSFWVIIALVGGPANASNGPDGVQFIDANADNYPDYDNAASQFYFGFCPPSAWTVPPSPPCRDSSATSRHAVGDAEYDADDYARDQADFIADPVDGQGITVFTIGWGELVNNTTIGDADAGAQLLTYIAENAGDNLASIPPIYANHGFYSDSPDAAALQVIFDKIAENIFTRISQ